MVKSRLRSRRIHGSKFDSIDDAPCLRPVACQIIRSGQTSFAGVERNFGEGEPEQVSFSSSNSVSKLRSQSQNSPSVASKRDVNITKLNADLYVNLNGANALSLLKYEKMGRATLSESLCRIFRRFQYFLFEYIKVENC
ncbi:hypothetical protein AVEN_141749-1 [Araneus ventricosus]|uniref:Uncharacterized protein n=1 Tax=Araneus ventricosus TaxID=182803 RepID=A0A4Y2W880_ARAVE|nr:hypothetical protein AVEN_141749-1 [Araneus ventricosus]